MMNNPLSTHPGGPFGNPDACLGRNSPARMIKLGGSLFDAAADDQSNSTDWQSELRDALLGWVAAQPPIRNIVLVGGGQRVEALRRNVELDSVAAHWQAIRCMETNAMDFARQHGLAVVEDCPSAMKASEPLAVLGTIEPSLRRSDLPEDWCVTSDSIAAWFAAQYGASELVLLKSCDAPQDSKALARMGIVDSFFPKVASQIGYRVVNLRRWITMSRTSRNDRLLELECSPNHHPQPCSQPISKSQSAPRRKP